LAVLSDCRTSHRGETTPETSTRIRLDALDGTRSDALAAVANPARHKVPSAAIIRTCPLIFFAPECATSAVTSNVVILPEYNKKKRLVNY
jgi:hypothetical protein